MIKTLVVDDSPVMRMLIKDFIESDPLFKVVGEAVDGHDAVEKTLALNPDLVTLDIMMPRKSGLEAIEEIKRLTPMTPIVVISCQDCAEIAYEATVKGALEFYSKEQFTNLAGAKRKEVFETLKRISGIKSKRSRIPLAVRRDGRKRDIPVVQGIVIAASTGGPKALRQLFSALPKDFPVPIVTVQHNSSGFDKDFAQWLNGYSELEVKLAEDWEIPQKGKIYIAPTDRHLVLRGNFFIFDNRPPVQNQKPSADVLVRSAVQTWKDSIVSVVLTGMGADGADGTKAVYEAGGVTIAQDEASSMIYGMPKAAYETGCVDLVLPLERIPAKLLSIVKEHK
jgi:two-component system chemotaxis response regulator CheB